MRGLSVPMELRLEELAGGLFFVVLAADHPSGMEGSLIHLWIRNFIVGEGGSLRASLLRRHAFSVI